MKKRLDILLINPPYSNVFAPLLGTPCLMGFIKQQNELTNAGISAEQLDLSILHFRNMVAKYGLISAAYLKQREYVENLSNDQKIKIQYENFDEYLQDCAFLAHDVLSIEYIKSIIQDLNRRQLNVLDMWIEMVLAGSGITTIEDINFDPDNQKLMRDASDLLDTLYSSRWFSENQEFPKVVGFSVSFSAQMPVALLYAKIIKKMSPNIKITVGGSYIDIMVSGSQTTMILNSLKIVDYLSFHEGETSIVKLIQCVNNKEVGCEDVPNLIYKKKDGSVKKTEVLLENVAELPLPDFTGINLDDYLMPGGMLPYQTSRGCFYGHCAFCAHDKNYRGNYRTKPVSKCVDELIMLKYKYGCQHIVFVDEAIEYSYFNEMVKEMDRNEAFHGIEWMYYSRVDNRYTKEILDLAYKNGCRMVFFGVETFSQRLLSFIKKGARSDVAESNLRLFSNVGIKTFIWMMYGLPSQTPDDVLFDIDKIKENEDQIFSVALGLFGLFPATDMYKNPSKFNILRFSEDPYDFVSHFNGEEISRETIYKLAGRQYYPYLFKQFSSTNRFLAYIETKKDKKEVETGINKSEILAGIIEYSAVNKQSFCHIEDDIEHRKLVNYIAKLSEGKDWLESQLDNYKTENQMKENVITELREWTHQLEEAKEWLAKQYENYKLESEQKDKIIQELRNKAK